MAALPWHSSRGSAASRAHDDAFDFPYDDLLAKVSEINNSSITNYMVVVLVHGEEMGQE